MLQLRKQFYSLCIIFLGLVALGANANAADTRVGIVNTATLLKEAPQAEAASKKIKSEFAPRDAQIVELQKVIKNLENKLSKNASIMSEAARKKQEREIVSKKRDVKRASEELIEDYNFRRNEEIGKLQKLVSETIISLAKEKEYDIILNESVIYSSKQVDITSIVMERLRKLYKKDQLKK